MKLIVKLLILFVAAGLLPWIAFLVGQVGYRIAFYAHAFGVVVVAGMKLYEWLTSKKDVGKSA